MGTVILVGLLMYPDIYLCSATLSESSLSTIFAITLWAENIHALQRWWWVGRGMNYWCALLVSKPWWELCMPILTRTSHPHTLTHSLSEWQTHQSRNIMRLLTSCTLSRRDRRENYRSSSPHPPPPSLPPPTTHLPTPVCVCVCGLLAMCVVSQMFVPYICTWQ